MASPKQQPPGSILRKSLLHPFNFADREEMIESIREEREREREREEKREEGYRDFDIFREKRNREREISRRGKRREEEKRREEKEKREENSRGKEQKPAIRFRSHRTGPYQILSRRIKGMGMGIGSHSTAQHSTG